MNSLIVLFPLVAGYVLDLLLGDPRRLPHPVVGFGYMIAWVEKHWNCGVGRQLKGAVIALLYPAIVFVAAWTIGCGAMFVGMWCYIAVAAVFVFYGLASRSLIQEGGEVIKTLKEQGIEAGRKRLSWIVGRDTSQLSVKEIYTAVLETMAENLSDGVVAPLFYYALGGFPAMMAYKMVNTLDSMIGYKDERYRQFGCWSARLDDVLNYIPARLTALLMVGVAYRPGLVRFVLRYGRMHASPNAGFPEAAMAGILNCRFGGAHVYHGILVGKPYIGDCNRELTEEDYRKAVGINRTVTATMVVLTGLYVLWMNTIK
ncbi:adenosylcobinamide-phosphate synthase CbiB [Odoribacter sp. Z80]|uniref:adenosylcobinamide-phosphate synthase CbiB n=1 Tax=Odoribacter sp. Z80 TaxID=2304575 RepID=UPI001379F22F|nr:adenosylcobinamide-phosphate synthase CbiB [Odoribacter sp. Z80]NCE72123.1 cobalamin biosynthesis protein CobD [Odoribacter sp. Z80]